jgi:hypothetical protein
MLFVNRLLLVGLLCVGITAATTAHAGNQLFQGSWIVNSWGNEITGGTGPSEYYQKWGLPLGNLCNPAQPRCPFDSTPTDGDGNFAVLGGSPDYAIYCGPWADWQGQGTTARPAKGATATTTAMGRRTPPLYRNPRFFIAGGEPDSGFCSATTTGATPGGKGVGQAGHPVVGTWTAITTGTQMGGFSFGAAPAVPGGWGGLRTTGLVGSFPNVYPYLYSYTYATLRNDIGAFAPGGGPGSFNLKSYQGANTTASVNVKKGAAKFGGTMQMLGALTTKACLFRNGGCSIGTLPLLYAAAGASAYTSGGVVTGGYLTSTTARYYHTALMQTSTVLLEGERFPWTTGSVTVTAIATATHTVEYNHGYDNRNTGTSNGLGTIQLVTPVLTRWLQPGFNIASGGIGVLRIKFVPEPQMWMMLVAGIWLLGVGYRLRRR